MAAGLGFKTFNTGDVLSANDVNGYLMQGVWVFADAAARSAAVTSPQEGNFSYLKDTNKLYYYTGSAWAEAGGGGKILQVVQSAKTNTFTTSSSSPVVITDLSVTITPSSASSRILVMAQITGSSDTAQGFPVFYLYRESTAIFIGDAGQANQRRVTAGMFCNANYITSIPITYVDSPATTSARTYAIYTSTADSAGSVFINRTSVDGNNNYNARSASSIIVMEIGA